MFFLYAFARIIFAHFARGAWRASAPPVNDNRYLRVCNPRGNGAHVLCDIIILYYMARHVILLKRRVRCALRARSALWRRRHSFFGGFKNAFFTPLSHVSLFFYLSYLFISLLTLPARTWNSSFLYSSSACHKHRHGWRQRKQFRHRCRRARGAHVAWARGI